VSVYNNFSQIKFLDSVLSKQLVTCTVVSLL